MRLGIIGAGAIGRFVHEQIDSQQHAVKAWVVRPERVAAMRDELPAVACVAAFEDLPAGIDLMIDCAGHGALREFGPAILRRGIDLLTVSIGALADDGLHTALNEAAAAGNARLHLAGGAIGALDCLRAARVGALQSVTYTGRKPPASWRGSPAEERLDLDKLDNEPAVHFVGTARNAAREYPKNANVAAAVALSGVGFDKTRVQLIADPTINENIHEIEASGDFGRLSFQIAGHSLPDNHKSSALAAMSVVSKLDELTRSISF